MDRIALERKFGSYIQLGKIVFLLILFSINFLPLRDISACTYTLDTPYLTSIFPTENKEIYLIGIRADDPSIEFSMILNVSEMSLSSGLLLETITGITPIISVSPYQSIVFIYEDQINWQLRDSENNSILNMVLPTNLGVSKYWTFENIKLNRTYLILGDTRYYDEARMYSIYLNGTDFRNETISWDVYSNEWAPYVYEEEGLLYASGPTSLCISGYYYRFNQTGGISRFKTLYTYMKSLVDTRSQIILVLNKMANRIEIINYNLNLQIPTKSKEFSRTWLFDFLKTSDSTDIFREVTTNFLGIGTLLLFSSLYVIFTRRRRQKYQ